MVLTRAIFYAGVPAVVLSCASGELYAQVAPTRAPTVAPAAASGAQTRVSLGFLAEASPLPVVVALAPNGAAARAGILVADTIVQVDGKPASLDALAHVTTTARAGDRIALRIRRAGRELLVSVVAQELVPARVPLTVNRDSVAVKATEYLVAACRAVNGPPKNAADSAALACAAAAPTMVRDRLLPSRMTPLRRWYDAAGARFRMQPDPSASTNRPVWLVVESVESGSKAAKAGLAANDHVTHVGDSVANSLEVLVEAVESGRDVELTVQRGSSTRKVTLRAQ